MFSIRRLERELFLEIPVPIMRIANGANFRVALNLAASVNTKVALTLRG
jgi:hypothetical protein